VGESYVILLGQVVWKPVNTNQGLKVNQGNNFSFMKMLSGTMFCVVWEYLCSKLESKKYKLDAWLKNYKNEIKILAKSGLA